MQECPLSSLKQKQIRYASFSQSLSLHSHLSLAQAHLTTQCLAVTGGGSVGEYDRLNQPGWLLVHYNIVILTYLLTSLMNSRLSLDATDSSQPIASHERCRSMFGLRLDYCLQSTRLVDCRSCYNTSNIAFQPRAADHPVRLCTYFDSVMA